jgi:predicted MFS family arabinose efflux permease
VNYRLLRYERLREAFSGYRFPLAIGTALLFGFAFGFHETIYFALSMGFSDPRAAGTMYAIFMAMGNIGPVTGEPLMGNLAEGWGFIPAFYLFATVNIVNLPLVAATLHLKREQPQQ